MLLLLTERHPFILIRNIQIPCSFYLDAKVIHRVALYFLLSLTLYFNHCTIVPIK